MHNDTPAVCAWLCRIMNSARFSLRLVNNRKWLLALDLGQGQNVDSCKCQNVNHNHVNISLSTYAAGGVRWVSSSLKPIFSLKIVSLVGCSMMLLLSEGLKERK